MWFLYLIIVDVGIKSIASTGFLTNLQLSIAAASYCYSIDVYWRLLSVRVTSTSRPSAYARSEANVEQIVVGLHEQAVCTFRYFMSLMLSYDTFNGV